MDKDEFIKEGRRSIKEFDIAWEEFFKDNPRPKNDKEDREQQEAFYHWYNYVRKQSDTGKTPSQMYMEIHGEEADKYPKWPNRIMNFEWDEHDDEIFNDDLADEEYEEIIAYLPSVCEIKDFFNSSKSDNLKSALLLKNLILFDRMHKIPTAKEIAKNYFESNVKNELKVEIANYILNEMYIPSSLIKELRSKNIKERSPFMKEVEELIEEELGDVYYLGTNFNFVRRETVIWLIENSENPKESILNLFKEKVDWGDFPTQNGILDYCYKNLEMLGKDFVINIIDKSTKTNMREVRITALKYAYLITKDVKYMDLIEKDPSSLIRKMASDLKNKTGESKNV